MPDTWEGCLRGSIVTVPIRAYTANAAGAGVDDTTESDRAVQIRAFVAPDAIDAVYHSGQTYYLAPDGPGGEKSYALLHGSMMRLQLHALAQVVLGGKEQLVLLRPDRHVITMTMLRDASEIVRPSVLGPVTIEEPSPAEMEHVDALLRMLTAKDVEKPMRLTQSVEAEAPPEAGEKPAKKMAKSVSKKGEARKRKSS